MMPPPNSTPSESDSRPTEDEAPVTARRTPIRLALLMAAVLVALGVWRTGERGLFTAHEARAARVAHNMLHAETWPDGEPSPWLMGQFSAHGDDELNYQKPPLYYWAAAFASEAVGRVTRLSVRLPSILSYVLVAFIVYHLGKTVADARTGLVAMIVWASTPKIIWWGRAAVLDPMLTACVAGSLLFFIRAHRRRGGAWQMYLFWGLAGLGTLVKATSLVIPLLAAGLYMLARVRQEGVWPQIKRIRPLTGPLVLLAVAAPWHIAAHVATGGTFSEVYWGMHVFGRALGGEEPETGRRIFEETTSWWYYLVAMARDFFPWIVFLPGALLQVWRKRSREDRAGMLLPFAWFAGTLVFFSAISFRKDEYMLVAYPAAAVLVGYLLARFVESVHGRETDDPALRPWIRTAFWTVGVAVAMVGLTLAAYALSNSLQEWVLEQVADNETDVAVARGLARQFAETSWLVPVLIGPVAAGVILTLGSYHRRRPGAAVMALGCTMIVSTIVFTLTIEPVLHQTRSLAPFARVVQGKLWARAEYPPGAATGREAELPGVLLAVAECHELAFELAGVVTLREDLGETPVETFLQRRVAAGEEWFVITDAERWDSRPWQAEGMEFEVLHAMPPQHRRPMVLLAARAEEKPANEEPDEREN